ncbi:hypothetical protein RIF29_10282 [Crotalaria pallida]|uniref:Uncharacterized protein n=1 Tax=Crotalaria pallida TaxID=3830 RepID=A0AAN9FV40_CROPI
MAKKRGRLPLSPSPSKHTSKDDKGDHPLFDIAELDKEDLTIINSLSTKQTENLLLNLEAIRAKIARKDHSPILIDWGEPLQIRNMWVGHSTFMQIVHSVWSQQIEGSLMFQICKKLNILKTPLSALNRQHFAHFDRREVDIKDILDLVQNELIQNLNDVSLHMTEKDLCRQYSEIKLSAFSFLRQKAKLMWLKDGDVNSKLFHSSIKSRLYHSRILRLLTPSGETVDNQKDIEKLFLDFNSELFKRKDHRANMNSSVIKEGVPS